MAGNGDGSVPENAPDYASITTSPVLHRAGGRARSSSRTSISSDKTNRRQAGRRLLGLALLALTVVLWTGFNFLGSSMFADDSYTNVYFVIYFNTASFTLLIIPLSIRRYYRRKFQSWTSSRSSRGYYPVPTSTDGREHGHEGDITFRRSFEDHPINCSERAEMAQSRKIESSDMVPLTFRETAMTSFKFVFVWFTANYLSAGCLQYTTVASMTILTSTSSIFTLLFGSITGVEKFTLKKLIAVLASFTGVLLISSVDLYGDHNTNRGSFPHKSSAELVLGDAMALVSAALYGIYAVGLTKSIGHESRINMPLFFAILGVIGVVLLWPGFLVLHFTGIERWALPPTKRIWSTIFAGAVSSVIADLAWAYSMLLISPLVVTVGLSLTIPLSLVGQMVVNSQSSSLLYWIGAAIVVLSFVFVSYDTSGNPTPQAMSSED